MLLYDLLAHAHYTGVTTLSLTACIALFDI